MFDRKGSVLQNEQPQLCFYIVIHSKLLRFRTQMFTEEVRTFICRPVAPVKPNRPQKVSSEELPLQVRES